MAAKRGRTAQRLELGLQLRQLRESCGLGDRGGGLTRRQAVQGLRISEASLLRIEQGALNFRNIGDLRKLLDKYGVSDEDVVESLISLNKESNQQDWLTQYRGLVPTGMPAFVGLEPEARSMKVYHPTLVYGLLQTQPYARALLEAHKPIEDTTAEFVRSSVELRMKRQEVLTREGPVKLHVILGEAALRYPVGGSEVMREQYARIEQASGWEHVTIDSPWGATHTSDKRRVVDRFIRRFEAMTASALPPEDTPDFLHRLQREL